jgi:hypothetical protein
MNETMMNQKEFSSALSSFLSSVFGDGITVESCAFSRETPFFIIDGYVPFMIAWGENRCVVLRPVNETLRLPSMKANLEHYQRISSEPCALALDNLTSLQRRNLMESRIPFVSLSQQIYLPFLGCIFSERFRSMPSPGEKMAPGTQLVFLYLYYRRNEQRENMSDIASALSLSKATCTRAVDDLLSSGLIKVSTEGTKKWIEPLYAKNEFLGKGWNRLKSPVEKVIYLKTAYSGFCGIIGGIRALEKSTMVCALESDGAVAVSRKSARDIPSPDICSKEYFEDFGGSVVEVWSYDPAVFAAGGHVDDISLILSLEDSSDERVQAALDEIRKRHGLEAKD